MIINHKVSVTVYCPQTKKKKKVKSSWTWAVRLSDALGCQLITKWTFQYQKDQAIMRTLTGSCSSLIPHSFTVFGWSWGSVTVGTQVVFPCPFSIMSYSAEVLLQDLCYLCQTWRLCVVMRYSCVSNVSASLACQAMSSLFHKSLSRPHCWCLLLICCYYFLFKLITPWSYGVMQSVLCAISEGPKAMCKLVVFSSWRSSHNQSTFQHLSTPVGKAFRSMLSLVRLYPNASVPGNWHGSYLEVMACK